ncbi:hypothetical protein ABZW32_09175 [Streptomyces sp. NPDC004667]|uniref:hypothetical protein n=1 Tax=Streptomyces sp. NPDC004667 TaxID=3154285 RepID=UPI0033B72DAA
MLSYPAAIPLSTRSLNHLADLIRTQRPRRPRGWATIEQLAPNQPDLRIDGELYQRWRDRVAIRVRGRPGLRPTVAVAGPRAAGKCERAR